MLLLALWRPLVDNPVLGTLPPPTGNLVSCLSFNLTPVRCLTLSAFVQLTRFHPPHVMFFIFICVITDYIKAFFISIIPCSDKEKGKINSVSKDL